MANIVSAVFDDRNDAERAVDWLRDNGVAETAVSIVGRHEGAYTDTGYRDETDDDDTAEEVGKGTLTGVGVGAGVGAIFGLAAAAIPGIGPFITAGALANVLGAAGGAAVAGATVGAASGGLAGALASWGVSENESRYYAGEVERGGTYVGVDLDRTTISRDTVMDAFRRYGGRFQETRY
jgi:hypothetical protein